MNIVICTLKSWNIRMAENFKNDYINQYNIKIITAKSELDYNYIVNFKPDYIFFPHWSYIIPEEIFKNFECIVFHITDLPYGRGGSPLQNLIAGGKTETKISALRVVKQLDAGPIYRKRDLSLYGNAEEIFIRTGKVIFNEMIPEIINNRLEPAEQEGEIVEFKRRKKSESEITDDMPLEKIYDYIRMLDAEGYPHSFIRFGNYKLSFTRASLKDGKIIADVEIKEVKDE